MPLPCRRFAYMSSAGDCHRISRYRGGWESRRASAARRTSRLAISAAVIFTTSLSPNTSNAFCTSGAMANSVHHGVADSGCGSSGRGSSPLAEATFCKRAVLRGSGRFGNQSRNAHSLMFGTQSPAAAATVARKQRGGATMLAGALPSSLVRPEVVAASARAVAELLSCCVLGVVAAKGGILNPASVSALSKVVYGIFLPALLITNVAKTCISQPAASLLPIPIFSIVQIAIGLFVSRFTMKLLHVDGSTEEGRETKVCSAFQNSGILPLLFINAMLRSNPDPAVLSRGVAYVSFYLMGWSPTFWSVGRNILTGYLDKDDVSSASGITAERKQGFVGRTKDFPSAVGRFATGKAVKNFLSPPIVACIAGLAIGVLPPLQWLVMSRRAPLAPIWAALTNLSAAYTPSGVLVLAGSLANCPPNGGLISKSTGKTIASVAMVRWLLMPIVTAGLLYGGLTLGFIPQDPMLLFVLMMESCMPPAQNSVIILQVAGLQDAAGRNARTLCTIYLISILPVSCLLTLFLSNLALV